MKNILSLTVLFLLVSGFSMVDEEIEGRWKGNMGGPNSGLVVFYNFEVENDSLIGTIELGPEEVEIKNGIINGKSFSFETHMQGQVYSHKCTLLGENEIEMKLRSNMYADSKEPTKLTLKRVEEKEQN